MGYSILGSVATEEGRLPAAEASFQAALAIVENVLGPDDVRTSEGIANLGLFYAATHDMGKAEPLLEDAHARLNAWHANSLFRRGFLLHYSEVERASGHSKKARELLSEARSLTAQSSAASFSQYIIDASAHRH